MALNALPLLNRAKLAAVFPDTTTMLAFEQYIRQIAEGVPDFTTALTSVKFIVGVADPTTPSALVATGGDGIVITTPPGEMLFTLGNTGVAAGSYTVPSITVDNHGRITSAANSAAVLSLSGGTTGLTPATATQGAVTLAGTLALAHGGTGATSAVGARTGLGLGGAAVLNVGITTGTVAAGDDTRFSNAKPSYQTVATDADFAITRSASANMVRHTGTLTANRAVTLSTTGAVAGDSVLLTRTGSGAFTLTFAGKALGTASWASAVYDGAAWYLASYGTL